MYIKVSYIDAYKYNILFKKIFIFYIILWNTQFKVVNQNKRIF